MAHSFVHAQKNSGNTVKVSTQCDHILRYFLDESNLTLTSFLGLDAKRISDRNKRLFHWSNEEGFISNQSKMLYYWGGTFSLKKLVNMSELEEVSVKDCPIVCRNPLDI